MYLVQTTLHKKQLKNYHQDQLYHKKENEEIDSTKYCSWNLDQ